MTIKLNLQSFTARHLCNYYGLSIWRGPNANRIHSILGILNYARQKKKQ